ncbi:MAG: O-antigen ligase family protein [Chitinophagales bacterium]
MEHSAISRFQLNGVLAYCAFALVCCLAAFKTDQLYLAAAPLLVAVMAWGILNYKSLYFFLLIMIPCSIEYFFSSSLATDLPTEPLMVGLMLITFAVLALQGDKLPRAYFLHPLILTLGLHYFWILITAINSENILHSAKIFLAKTWYITTFTILTSILIKTRKDLQRLFWCIFIPLLVLTVITVLRHGLLYQFGFTEVNKCVTPYFRNHVAYAAILSVFFPMVLLARSWYARGSWTRFWLNVSLVFLVAAIYLSFTRTAMLALLAMIPFYFMVKWRLTRVALAVLAVALTVVVVHTVHDNHYMKYAPDFQATVYHDDFNSHLSSTFEGKDVSSMERVYRWVAAMRMSRERPWMGVGPGNFFDYYKSYTVLNFETYISENEERSTVHNYFLLMLTEQGAIGLAIFLLLAAVIFIYGEKLYLQVQGEANKRTVMALLLVLLSVFVNLLLSDMMETDKVGPFFFIALGLLANFGRNAMEA